MSRLRQRRGNREGLNAGSQCSSPSPSLLAPRPLSRARLDFLFTNASIGPLGGLNNYIDHRIVAVAAQPLGARPAASQSVSKLERLTSRLERFVAIFGPLKHGGLGGRDDERSRTTLGLIAVFELAINI